MGVAALPVALSAAGLLGAGAGSAAFLNQQKQAAKGSQNALENMQNEQRSQFETAQRDLLLKPKQISPDNFLSTKASQLAKLRLGMASTVSGSGMSVPSPILSSSALSPNGAGKSKLGA